MSFQDEVQKAVQTHALWKIELLKAIDDGKTTAHSPEQVQLDNACIFGRWLYSDSITEKAKSLQQYALCLELHKEFHILASRILMMAIEGKRLEALNALSADSEYSALSSRLIRLMLDWGNAFEKANTGTEQGA